MKSSFMIKRIKIRHHYTLIEILAAMAVFSIVCLVVARFFNGAQKLVSASNSYNEMFADARTLFDIIDSDLQTIVYNNEISAAGKYPFAMSFYPIPSASSSGVAPFTNRDYRENIQNFYNTNIVPSVLHKMIAYDDDNSKYLRDYVPLLCFIANPRHLPFDASYPLAEVRYTFLPAGTGTEKLADTKFREAGSSSLSDELFTGGKILRSVTYADSNKTDATITNRANRHPHDTETFPVLDRSNTPVTEYGSSNHNRAYLVFGDRSSAKYEEIIGHVYRMNITCLKLDMDFTDTNNIRYVYKKLPMFNVNKSTINGNIASNDKDVIREYGEDKASYLIWPPNLDPEDTSNSPGAVKQYQYPGTSNNIELLQLGHPLPNVIKIDLYMLSPKDWNALMNTYNWKDRKFKDENEARKILARKLKKFSRMFYINR